jgi:SNF2 family DNA or RNA helicase
MLRVKKEASFASKVAAFPYQLETVESIKSLEYAAIFHEQGLGKTKIAIDLSLTWLTEKTLDSVVIITKKGLIRNWEEEIATHSHFKAKTIDQNPKTLFYAFNTPARIYLTHYETCKSAQRSFALFLKTRRVGAICDESQKIKNPDSAVAHALHELSKGFNRRVIMTGTPIANRPYDIWSQIWFLDQGKSLGNDFATFRADLDLPQEDAGTTGRTLFAEALSGILEKIQAFTVRKTKASSGIILPSKVVENVKVHFESQQQRLYNRFRDELSAEVVRNSKTVTDDAEAILKRLLRLVQVASNPALVDESYKGMPAKFPKLQSILNSAIRGGSKAIVWTSFTENADWLARELAAYGAVKVHGKMSIEDRNSAIARFKNDFDTKVFVATPGAAKEGLTLTVANYAVFYDRSFSLDDYLQAQDRIHRISQKSTCYVYNLLVEDSIDEWVNELLCAKHLAAQLGQGDITRKDFSEKMSYAFSAMLADVLNVRGEQKTNKLYSYERIK